MQAIRQISDQIGWVRIIEQALQQMEAFIIEERVLTAEHMRRLPKFQRLKYVKKYDLPYQNDYENKLSKTATSKSHDHHLANYSAETPSSVKTKNLLSNLNFEDRNSCDQIDSKRMKKFDLLFQNQNKLEKTFSEKRRETARNPLLRIKATGIPFQHYDSRYSSVQKRSPAWAIAPQHTHSAKTVQKEAQVPLTIQQRIDRQWQQQKLRRKIHKIKSKRRVFNRMETMKGLKDSQKQNMFLQIAQARLHQEIKSNYHKRDFTKLLGSEIKLSYSQSQLFRSTHQIIKKYHFQNSNYFKKILEEMV